MKSYVLLALCLCASAMSATAANTETPELHLRSLRDQEANAQAQPTTNGPVVDSEAQRAPGRAVHRVYDAVTGLYCERVGDCHVCPASEKDGVSCRETGHRQELSCFKSDTVDANAPDAAKEQRFQSCEPVERAHPALRVLTFEFFMALILAGAFTLLKRERRKHLSAFDLRKDPRQRSTLLGDKNAD